MAKSGVRFSNQCQNPSECDFRRCDPLAFVQFHNGTMYPSCKYGVKGGSCKNEKAIRKAKHEKRS